MLKWSWIALLVIIIDQISKYAALKLLPPDIGVPITAFLNFTLTFNAGTAFGLFNNPGGWQNLIFVLVAVVASISILFMVYRLKDNETQVAIALMLILGGALGNLIDRVHLNHVVDFIDFFYRTWHFYIFNIADSAITIGAILLGLDAVGLRFGKKHPV